MLGKIDSINTDEKAVTYYHRAYRKLKSKNKVYILLEFLILNGFFISLILFSYPLITSFTSSFTKSALSPLFKNIEIIIKPYLLKGVYIVAFAGKYPTRSFALLMVLISSLIIFLIPWIKKIPKPISFWIIFIFLINLISSLFFVFFADKFPYSLTIFSELYIKTEIAMWLLIPVLLTLAFIPLPSNILEKFIVITITLAYSVIFGCVRYVVFLYVLREFSYLFMAMLFFIFGPLMDSIYIVGIYSFYVSILAKKIKRKMKVWKWLY